MTNLNAINKTLDRAEELMGGDWEVVKIETEPSDRHDRYIFTIVTTLPIEYSDSGISLLDDSDYSELFLQFIDSARISSDKLVFDKNILSTVIDRIINYDDVVDYRYGGHSAKFDNNEVILKITIHASYYRRNS